MGLATLSIVILTTVAAQKNDEGLFNSSVLVAIISLLSAVTVAYLGYRGIKETRKSHDRPQEDLPTPSEQHEVDLVGLAAARVEALRTYGPASKQRLDKSRVDLERAAAALHPDSQAPLRALVLKLARCTDPEQAAGLQDRLTRACD